MMVQRLAGIIIAGFLLDFIIWFGLRRFPSPQHTGFNKKNLRRIHLAIIVLFLCFSLIFLGATGFPGTNFQKFRSYMLLFDIFGSLYFTKLIIALFILCGEVWHIITRLIKRLKGHTGLEVKPVLKVPPEFKLGIAFGSIILLAFLYGSIWGRSDFRTRHVELYSAGLPAAFEGFRIGQVSDIHLGSWWDPGDVRKGLNILAGQRPDMIVMTGDLINVNPDEALPYLPDLEKLNALYGKYAILGNHDIGDYTRIERTDYTLRNIEGIGEIYRKSGFLLLRNQHVIIKKGADSIALLGIDNWSLKRFRKMGKLAEAYSGISQVPYKILLSHDPSHWRAEVLGKTNIDLTLSGHTHGLQMGISTGSFRWSPFAFVASEWVGLYQEKEQSLYVNAGFGYVGFAARLGIAPEITLITLHRGLKP
jgi:uncharacterized protein